MRLVKLLILTKYEVAHIVANDIKKGEKMTYSTGEKPGKGTYVCTNCGQQVVLDDVTDTLPPCPKCNNTTYTK